MLKSLYRWFLEKLYIYLDPHGINMIKMIKFDLFKDIYVSTMLSIRSNPKDWHKLIKTVGSQSIPKTKESAQLYKLMGGEKYMKIPKSYSLYKTKDSLDELIDKDNGPNNTWN